MLIISIFIVSVIGSPKPKCLCYIVLSGCRPVVPQYLLLMPLDLHQDDGAVDYYKDWGLPLNTEVIIWSWCLFLGRNLPIFFLYKITHLLFCFLFPYLHISGQNCSIPLHICISFSCLVQISWKNVVKQRADRALKEGKLLWQDLAFIVMSTNAQLIWALLIADGKFWTWVDQL